MGSSKGRKTKNKKKYVTARRKQKSAGRRESEKVVFYAPTLVDARVSEKTRSGFINKLRRAEKSFTAANHEREEFNVLHLPEYDRWFQENFSHELSALHELQERLMEKRSQMKARLTSELIEELGFDEEDIDDFIGKSSGGVDFEFSEEESYEASCDCPHCRAAQKRAQGEYLSYEELEELLAEEFEEYFGLPPYFSRETRRAFKRFKQEAEQSGFFAESEKSLSPALGGSSKDFSLQIKHYYRLLVRRLHPDTTHERTAFKVELWNQLQESYARRDLRSMKQLLVLSSISDKTKLACLPTGDIDGAAESLKERTKHVRQELRRLKKGPAWGFARLSESEKKQMQRACKREFSEVVRSIKEEIRELDYLVSNIERESAPHGKFATVNSR